MKARHSIGLACLLLLALLLGPPVAAQFNRMIDRLIFEGQTPDAFETTLLVTEPTADRTVAVPDADVTLTAGTMVNTITATANETTASDGGGGNWTVGIADPLIVGKGGTGAATLTDGGLLLGSGTGAVTALGVAANGQVPIGDGTTDPVLATITGGTAITVTDGAGSITIDSDLGTSIDLASEVTGTLPVGSGGSGATSLTGLLIGNGASAFTAATTSAGVAGEVSDETGTGVMVFDTAPVFTTSIESALLRGGTGVADNLTLQSTSNATKGSILLGTTAAYDEANKRLSVGTQTADAEFHAESQGAGSFPVLRLSGEASAVTSGDVYGQVEFEGFDSSTNASGVRAAMKAVSEGSFGATALALFTTTDSSTTLNERLRVKADGTTAVSGDLTVDSANGDLWVDDSAGEVRVGFTADRWNAGLAVVDAIVAASNNTANANSISIGSISGVSKNFISANEIGTATSTPFPICFTVNGGTEAGCIQTDAGLVWGTASGGSQGAGTINAVAVYDDSTLLGPDYAFEPGYEYLDFDGLRKFIGRERHLPTMGRSDHLTGERTSNGARVKQLWETAEVQALYILELEERLSRLEGERTADAAHYASDFGLALYFGLGLGLLAVAQVVLQRRGGGAARRGA